MTGLQILVISQVFIFIRSFRPDVPDRDDIPRRNTFDEQEFQVEQFLAVSCLEVNQAMQQAARNQLRHKSR